MKLIVFTFLFILSSLTTLQSQESYVVQAEFLNVRSTPTAVNDSNIRGQLKKDSVIISIIHKRNWVGFKSGEGDTVYVYKKHLKEIQVESSQISEPIVSNDLSFNNLLEISWIYFVYILITMVLFSLIRHYLL